MMKFTLAWLKEHLDTDHSLGEIADKLTMIGLEVERIEDKAKAFAPFVIARVVEAKQHPNADRLRVCMVDTGAGAAVLGNPARCVAWLANKLASFGASLRAGDVILPGAVHRMISVTPGDVFRAEFAHLGTVTARFSGAGSLT